MERQGLTRRLRAWACALMLAPIPLWAQLPSECLLIVNGSSPEALRVANHYIALRAFPAERILVLEPPDAFFRNGDGSTRWTVPEAAAREHLLKPVLARLEELDDPSPAALLLTPDWPTRVRIRESPALSVTFFLGARGQAVPAEQVKTGRAITPWFTHPGDVKEKRARLRRYPAPELRNGPHPAAMLGVLHEPLDTGAIVAALRRAREADFTSPNGSVAIVTNADVRTTARLDQFEPAKASLEAKGVDVRLGARGMELPRRLIGVMTGAAKVDVSPYRGRLVPGSFAEHLTSHAATFDTAGQTKLTEWIAAGAAGSVGTVTEPLSIWMKFPMAAVFERYRVGNTLLEALTQSIASPVQALIVGDPLCRPWAESMKDLELKTSWKEQDLVVTADGAPSGAEFHLFANGERVPGDGPSWTLRPTAETTGPELELVLHARYLWAPPRIGSVRHRVDTPFPETLNLKAKVRGGNLEVEARGDGELMQWDVFAGGRALASESTSGKRHRMEIPLDRVGAGPVALRARGVTARGRVALSGLVDLDLPSR